MLSWKPEKKWTMKTAMAVSLPELLKMTKDERADLAQFFQTKFQQRWRDARQADSIPYGVQKIIDDMEIFREKYGVSIFDRVTNGVKNHHLSAKWNAVPYANNVLTSYIAMFQEFFTWKTNSVAGWNRVRAKESGELFGWKWEKQANGRRKRVPLYQMNDEERKAFWRTYHELLKRETNNLLPSDPSMVTNYAGIKDSGLARFWFELGENGYKFTSNDGNSADLLNILEASMKKGELTFPEHSFDVTGGDGNDPTFADDALEDNNAFN